MLKIWHGRLRREEQGFTLPELMATIVILGILAVIAVLIFLALLERWRVNTAANQLASDLRLAHQSATNQLTDWRVVLVPEQGDDETPDYYLVKLESAYKSKGGKPEVEKFIPRTLPANVRVMAQINKSKKAIQDDKGNDYYVSPVGSTSSPTRTLEFNSDGAMTGYGGSPSGTVRVTVDENPFRGVRYLSATSRIRVLH